MITMAYAGWCHRSVGAFTRITAAASGAALAALAMRAWLWWPRRFVLSDSIAFPKRVLAFAHDDLKLIAIGTLLLLLLAISLSRWPAPPRWIAGITFTLALICAIIFGITVTAVFWLHGPISYQWLYYADLFRSFTSQSAIGSVITAKAVAPVVLTVAVMLVTTLGLQRLLTPAGPREQLGCAAILLLLLVFARFDLPPPEGSDAGRIVDPMREFAETAWMSLRSPLSTMPTSDLPDDYRVGATGGATVAPQLLRRRRDVLLIIMESMPAADLIGSREGKPPVDVPNIAALRHAGMTFGNVYVPIASSSRTNFAVNTARYPLFTHRPETATLADKPFVTIASRLKQAGYRTAFFMGGEFAYQNVDGFLKGKGFDTLADLNTIPCAARRRATSERWQNNDHVADACVADAFLKWNAAAGASPHFAVLWTIDTHFPYLVDSGTPAGSRQAFVHSLKSSDAAIGRVMAGLQASGRADDTLVIVMGDHGESFGQHGFTVHGNSVFDQETRIPLILSDPHLFNGGTNDELASIIDLPPTILDLCGLTPETSWEGTQPVRTRPRATCVSLRHYA